MHAPQQCLINGKFQNSKLAYSIQNNHLKMERSYFHFNNIFNFLYFLDKHVSWSYLDLVKLWNILISNLFVRSNSREKFFSRNVPSFDILQNCPLFRILLLPQQKNFKKWGNRFPSSYYLILHNFHDSKFIVTRYFVNLYNFMLFKTYIQFILCYQERIRENSPKKRY